MSKNFDNLFVKFGMGKSNTVTIQGLGPNSTVKDLFKKIEDKEGIDDSNLRLIYGGKQLDVCLISI